MSSVFYDKTYVFSEKFSSEQNIKQILLNFDVVPLFIIRFILLTYRSKCESIISAILDNADNETCNLMDCIVASSYIKLCDMQVFKSICHEQCVCYKEFDYTNIYNGMIASIKRDPSIISVQSFNQNFTDIITKTCVYNDKLYDILNEIMCANRDNDIGIIKIIVDGNLFTHKYILLLTNLQTYTQNEAIKSACNKLISKIVKHNKRCTHIIDNIYISDIAYASNIPSIIDAEYTHIVSLTSKKLLKIKNGIEYRHIDIPDKANVDFVNNTIADISDLIPVTDSTAKILCHCFSGISRSVLFVSILISLRKKISFEDSYKIVKQNRKISHPNPELYRQIRDKLQNKIT